MVESKKDKSLRVASWIVLTVVPAIFAVLLLFFNWGFDAKGYVARLEKVEGQSAEIVPKVSKLEVDYSLAKLSDLFTTGEVNESKDNINKILSQLEVLNTNVAVLNNNVETIMKEKPYSVKAEDWSILQKKLDKLLERDK
jgi:outer membrane murein-binding lipoprotein Lpp